MIQRNLLWLFAILLLLPFSLALPSAYIDYNNSSSIFIETTQGVPQEFDLIVFNNGTEPIYNVTLSPIPFTNFSQIPVLEINQSAQIHGNVSPSQALPLTTYATVMRFHYAIPLTQENQIVNILVNESGFFPNNITVYQNDTLNFTNVGNDTHTVTALDLSFSHSLLPNESVQKRFESSGILDIFDQTTLFAGKINIQNLGFVTYVHDSAFDKAFAVSYKFNQPPTSLQLSLFSDSFDLEYDQQEVSVLKVTNIGSIPAYNVKVSGSWFDIANSSIPQLNAGKDLISFFAVSPNITKDNQTGITHSRIISAIADNAPQVNYNVSIYIKPHNFSTSQPTNTSQYIINLLTPEQLEAFCRQFPERCPQTNNTVIQYQPRILYPQINESDVESLITIVPDTLTRMDNLQRKNTEDTKEKMESVDTAVKNVESRVNDKLSSYDEKITNLTSRLQSDNEFYKQGMAESERLRKQQGEDYTLVGITISAIIILSLGFGSLVYFLSKKQKNELKNRHF